jgi:hypothetical protein
MKPLRFVCCAFLVCAFAACQKNTDAPAPSVPSIFLPYWNKFLLEGQKRGKTFSADEQAITIRLSGEARKVGANGLATLGTRTIDIDSVWLFYSDESKERLLFHELGHLMLKRPHVLGYLPNQEPASLMWTNEGNPDKCSLPMYKGTLRQTYYLNELFNPLTTVPAWVTEKIAWTEPPQSVATTVIGRADWNDNTAWTTLVSTSPDQISYTFNQGVMKLNVGKQTQSSGFRLPVSTLFSALTSAQLQNYEVRLRYKLYGRGFEMGWGPNNNVANSYFVSSNYCTSRSNLGVGANDDSFFFLDKISQPLNDWNEIVLRHKDNYVWVWLNQQLLFQSDVAAALGGACYWYLQNRCIGEEYVCVKTFFCLLKSDRPTP